MVMRPHDVINGWTLRAAIVGVTLLAPLQGGAVVQTLSGAMYEEGTRFLQAGNLEEAEERFRQALRKEPEFIAAQKGLGKVRIEQKRYPEALEVYKEILATNDCDMDARLAVAELYSWLRQYDHSIATYQDAVNRDAVNVAALKGLARVLRWATRYDESERYYQAVLALEPEDVEALAGLSQTLAQQQRFDAALRRVESALAIAPANPELLRQKADILTWSNHFKEAEAIYLLLLHATLDRAGIYHNLGDLYRWQGKLSQSVEAYNTAASLEPGAEHHLLSLGKTALEGGMLEVAKSTVQRMFALDPDNPAAFQLLRDIEARRGLDYRNILEAYVEPLVIVLVLSTIAVYFRRRMDILKRRHYYFWLVAYPVIPVLILTYMFFIAASRFGEFADFTLVKGVAEVVVFLVLMVAFMSLLWVSRRQQASGSGTVLAIGAHPDDIELGCGGALAKYKELGYEVHGLVMTSGEQGNPYLTKGKSRSVEAKDGAGVLGLDSLGVFAFRDTKLFSHLNDMKDVIEARIRETNPDIIITQSPHDIHQDHKAVFEATKIAARGPRTVLCYEDVSTEPHFVPNYFVDITEYIEDKVVAVGSHRTQKGKLYMEPEGIRGRAAHRGMQSGVRYAEAFLMYKGVDACPQ